jgi:hypothetical protein
VRPFRRSLRSQQRGQRGVRDGHGGDKRKDRAGCRYVHFLFSSQCRVHLSWPCLFASSPSIPNRCRTDLSIAVSQFPSCCETSADQLLCSDCSNRMEQRSRADKCTEPDRSLTGDYFQEGLSARIVKAIAHQVSQL